MKAHFFLLTERTTECSLTDSMFLYPSSELLNPVVDWFSLADPSEGAGDAHPLLIQFRSFSCSFRQKSCQIIGFCTKFRGWRLPIWEILDPPLILIITYFSLTGDRVEVSPRKGLRCTDSHQSDHRCADYKVRFYCPGMKELCHSKNKTNSTDDSDTNAKHDGLKKHVKASREKKRHENEILKNITKPRNKIGRSREGFETHSDAAFHKHLLWNDRQTEGRRNYQRVYVQWKNNRDPHRLSKWRNWG